MVPVALVMAVAGCAGGHDAPANNVTDTGATLNGSVSDTPNGTPEYWFAYGKTTSYGTETPHRTVQIDDRNAHPVSERVTGLDPDTTYHFQTCAKDQGADPICSADRAFTTKLAGTLAIGAQPSLYPDFDPSVTDYVTRCTGDPVSVMVSAPTGTTVAVAGAAARSGSFTQDVPLSVDQRFDFTTTTGGTSATYHVRCLPSDFGSWTFSRTQASTLDFTIVTPTLAFVPNHYVVFFNEDGVPVWWYKASGTPVDGKLLSDNTVAFGNYPGGPYQIRRLDGTLVRTVQTVGSTTDFHELQLLPNGDYLVDSYKPRDHVDLSPYGGPSDASIVDAVIQEIAPDGSVQWSWTSKGHIALSETGRWWPTVLHAAPPYDPVHINAIEPDGGSLLVSFRHLDAIYRISRSDGHIEWKLGGTTTPKSLTVSGDTASQPLAGQHDVRRLPDGTITVHDNGTGLNRPPRALRFRVDGAQKTATLVEKLSDPQVTNSSCCGTASKLDSGGWLVDWGGNPTVREYAADGSRISTLTFDTFFSYRAFPVPHGRISAAALRQGMDAMASTASSQQTVRPSLSANNDNAVSAAPIRSTVGGR